jgi:glycosyltransferase involved in cell wall biosynthesis
MTVRTDAKRVRPGARMRIALLDPGDFTPAYDEELAGGLCRLGHEVVLIGKHGGPLSSPEVRQPTFYALLARDWVRALPASVARSVKGAHHIVDMARLIVLLRRMRPDVIHFQWMPLPLVDAGFIGALHRIAPLGLTVHDSEPYQGATNRLMALGFNRLVRAADAVIAHTRSTAEQLKGLGLDPARLHQVPHGLLHGQALAEADRRPAAHGRLRLVQFGKIKAYKGVDVLIEALGMLKPEVRRRIHVSIVGAPYLDPQPLLQRVEQLGISDSVEFRLGFVPDNEMMGCFADADAMVFPYRQIDASGVLMAALAQGLPVIASRIGDFAELLQHGREALLVEPGDASALAAAIAALARSPERLAAMGSAMRRTRDAVPGWDEIAARTVAVYEHVRAHRAPTLAEATQQPERRVGVPAP